MTITDRFNEAIERMESVDMINLAKFFFDNRDAYLSSKELRIAGFLTDDLSSKRTHLKQYYGFIFDKIGNSWRLIDVTLNNKKREIVKRSRKRQPKRQPIKLIKKTATQVRIDSVFN